MNKKYSEHKLAVRALAKGAHLWNDNGNGAITSEAKASVAAFRMYACTNILPLMMSTHKIEYLIRECALVSTITERGEGMRSALMVLRSALMDAVRLLVEKRLLEEGKAVPKRMRGARRHEAIVDVARVIYEKFCALQFTKEEYASVFVAFCEKTNRSKQDCTAAQRAAFTDAPERGLNQ